MTDETSRNFQQFLTWLSPDPEEAARRYTDVHVLLTRVFARHGCDEPSRLADETLDRVIRKVDQVAPGYEGDPEPYLLGVARRIVLEEGRFQRRSWRRAGELRLVLPALADRTDADRERQHARLERCLAELTPDERLPILRYYGEPARARRALADEARVSEVALRKRT